MKDPGREKPGERPTQTRAGSIAPEAGKRPQFRPGVVLAGRYRIVELAGRGGMGEVYRAHDLKLDQTVALKFLPSDVAHDEERLARLLDEVRIARRVAHPNVCRVYDIEETEGRHFLSMEWIEGEDLTSVLRREGRLSRDRALLISRQLCTGLAAIHDCRVVHRDLKPSNVLIDERGVARITDFGLARTTAALRGDRSREGTLHYMAPEQLTGAEVTARSDLFALGLVLYEIFTGKPVYAGTTMEEITKERGEPLPPASELAPDIDPEVEKLILRCLDHEPARRPPGAREVEQALPGGDRTDEALAIAQRRADRIAAFRTEIAELRRAGLVTMGEQEMQAVDRYHEGVLTDLVRRFDVDLTERGKQLSLGMRVVSLLGAVALAASVFYFFYSIWGVIAIPLQVTILAVAPLIGLLGTAVIARRERAGYFTGMAALFAFACLVVNTALIQNIFNLAPSLYVVLAWGVFAMILAYGYRLRLLLVVGLSVLGFWLAGSLAHLTGGHWPDCAERPEHFIPAGLLLLAVGVLGPGIHPTGFASTYRVLGLVMLLGPSSLVAMNGFWSYLPWGRDAVEVAYQLTGFVASAGVIWLGITRRWRETLYGGALFFLVLLFLKFVDWWWEWMPKYLFFLIVALTAVLVMLVLRRLRAVLVMAREEGAV